MQRSRMLRYQLISERRKWLSQIPYDYATYLENNPCGDLVHVRMLPHKKEDLISGFLFCIANAKTKIEIELLKGGLATLAKFQDIGESDRLNTPDPADFDVETVEGMTVLLKVMQPASEIRQQLLPLVMGDHLRFQGLAKRAVAANEHMWPPYKRWWVKLKSHGAGRKIPAEWIDFDD